MEVLDDINQNTSDQDPSLPSGEKTSRKASRRASLFRRFLAFFCCTPTTMSMSRKCSIQIVDSESSSPSSHGSSRTAQVGLISVISLSDESYLSPSGETISEQDKSSIHCRDYELADKSSFDETVLEQDRISLDYPDSEGSDFTQSEDSTSQGYVTSEELQEESDTTDSTSHGYVTADESFGATVSEHERRSMPSPASDKSDSTQYEDSTLEIYTNELTLDSFTQSHASRPSIESTFPSCRTPTRLINVSINI